LTTYAVEVAPAGLAAGILASSLAAGSAAVTGTTTFIETLTMTTKLKATIAAAAVLAGAGTPVFLQHQEDKSLRAENQALLVQTSQFAALQAENERLSNRVVQMANNSPSDEQQVDLNRLRGEVARLRPEANQAEQLRQEINRLRSAQRPGVADAGSTSNALFAYLGEAVPPPANIDPAYSKEGLLNAIQQAAQLAGVSLKKVEIETSEFPFLAGVVCDSDADLRKLTAQFKNMPAYEYGGGSGSHGASAFNITPYRDLPSEEQKRIRSRTMLRTIMFIEQFAGPR